MSKLVITTVGTSLGGLDKLNEACKKFVKDLSENNSVSADVILNKKYNDQNDYENACLTHLNRDDLERKDYSAEIASLKSFKSLNKGSDKIILLSSDTPDGAFCTLVNAAYINNNIAKCDISNDIIIVKGLQSKDGNKFKNEGLPELLKIISNLIQDSRKEYKIILNITGGYKGLIPYMSLIGMCFDDIDIVYLYEESDELIYFNKLPVDFDILYWNDHRSIFNIVKNSSISFEAKKILIESLNKKFHPLFDIDEEDSTVKINAVGEFVSERLEKEKESISYYGSGRVLTELINDKSIREIIEKWISNSQHIWYGDLIAETVEHGRGHAQRLQEMAFQILNPIFSHQKSKNENRLLSDEELQILIYTLWLHDIGHSGRKVKLCDDDGNEFNPAIKIDIGPFPSLVRDLHHYTAYLMILEDLEKDKNNRMFFGKEIPIKDKGTFILGGKDENDAQKKGLLAAICYLYHRGKMKILEDRDKSNDMIFEDAVNIKEIFSFSQKSFINKYHNGLNANGYNLELITAIQRIVDACDVQLERAYSNELELRKKYTRELEIGTEKERMKVLVDAIKKVIDDSQNNDKEVYKQFIELINGNSSTDGWLKKEVEENYKTDKKEELSKLQKRFEKGGFKLNCETVNLYTLLRKLWLKRKDDKHDYLDVLFEEYLSCLDKIIWKHTPPPHFEKHKSIETVFFAQDDEFIKEENGKDFYRFWIYLKSNLKDGIEIPESINSICWDIGEEYKCTDVKNVFENSGIKLLGLKCFYKNNLFYKEMDGINNTNGNINIKWEKLNQTNNA
jgi:putative CRISPR-associated protein (TIGR02619 family)